MASFTPVRSLTRGLAVLRVISERGPIGTSDIARSMRLPQPTVYRIIETLLAAGYIYRQRDSHLFLVTGLTNSLSSGFEPATRLIEIGRDLVEQLRQEIDWPSNLAYFDQDAMVIGYSNRAMFGMSIHGRIGARIPMLATGVGMAYLAQLPEETLAKVLENIKRSRDRWDRDPRLWNDLDRRLNVVRQQGYGLADQEYLDAVYQSRIWAVAVPIVKGRHVYGGLSSLILRIGGEKKRLIRGVLPALQRTANAIAKKCADQGEV